VVVVVVGVGVVVVDVIGVGVVVDVVVEVDVEVDVDVEVEVDVDDELVVVVAQKPLISSQEFKPSSSLKKVLGSLVLHVPNPFITTIKLLVVLRKYFPSDNCVAFRIVPGPIKKQSGHKAADTLYTYEQQTIVVVVVVVITISLQEQSLTFPPTVNIFTLLAICSTLN